MLRAAGLVIDTLPLADHFDYLKNPFTHCDADRILIQVLEGGHVAHCLDTLLDLQLADSDVLQPRRRRRRAAIGSRHRLHELGDFVRLDSVFDHDALDARLLEAPHQLAHGFSGAGHRRNDHPAPLANCKYRVARGRFLR